VVHFPLDVRDFKKFLYRRDLPPAASNPRDQALVFRLQAPVDDVLALPRSAEFSIGVKPAAIESHVVAAT